MSVISALYTGVSGMAAMGKSLQVIGNNISNVNTVGFKGSRAEFSDLLSRAINTPAGKKQVGRGVRVAAVEGLFHQGSFESTPLVTDVAINGEGWFVVNDGQEDFYTRSGQFKINKDGLLTNSLGMAVQGFTIDDLGNVNGQRGSIDLTSATTPPNPTGDGAAEGSGIFINMNLDPLEKFSEDNGIAVFDADDPSGTSNFSTAVTVYDSQGGAHTCNVYFNKTADNEWEWRGFVDGNEITGGTPGVPVETATGTLSFDVNGNLVDQQVNTSDFDFIGGPAQDQSVGFDFTGSTQTRKGSITNMITQDGYSAGNLAAIDIDRDGVIVGVFNNGLTRNIAQITIANFPAEQELFRVGNSLFQETAKTGQPVYGVANTGVNGAIAASTLELSNVDLTAEFVDMITTQRSFQANSKVVTTGDEMIETVIQMKR